MANDIPNFRSYSDTLGQMIDATVSRFGIKNLKVGSAILSTLEAAAQSDVRTSQDIFNLLASRALDRAEGLALDRIGNDENIPRLIASPSNGKTLITDSSFEKISSRVFQGTSPPIIGAIGINISSVDAALFATIGNLYIGRGTPNFEGPIAYTSKTDNGTYVTLNLSGPTTKFHNTGEEVVLGQGGDRVLSSGAVVRTPQINNANTVDFRIVYSVTLFDGENTLEDTLVSCTVPGISGNVPANTIQEFATSPFPGATVTNPIPFTNGKATEDDVSYRDRIKNVRATRQKGTDLALVTAVANVISPDENRRITSSSIVSQIDAPSVLYIDDGSGYEEQSSGIGFEALIDIAGGGEKYVQATNRPIAKAFVISQNTAPFLLQEAAQLAVKVGGILYVHTFRSSDFVSISNASAYEVSSSINGNPDIAFGARTANGGKNVVIFSKEESNDDIEIVPVLLPNVDANTVVRFPSNRHYTTLLYKNDRLLNKDGTAAIILSKDVDAWLTLTGDQTLLLSVDGTPTATYTITGQDFLDLNTGYAVVGKNSLEAWATVLNYKIPGVTTTVENDQLVLTSNKGFSSKASLVMDPNSTLIGKIFEQTSAFGSSKDYILDRNVSQFRLEKTLASGDKLTLGTEWTRAFLESAAFAPSTVLADSRAWFATDANAAPVSHKFGAKNVISVFGVSDFGLWVALQPTLVSEPYKNVRPGDFLVLWDENFNATQKNVWRVSEVAPDFSSVAFRKRNMNVARSGHEAVGLTNGKVLAIGGVTSPSVQFASEPSVTATCEAWNPVDGSWDFVDSMSTARKLFASVLLSNGKVLVAGGIDEKGNYLDSIEIYDPGTDTWGPSPVVLTTPVARLAITLRSDNTVLITGGIDSTNIPSSNAYVLDATGTVLNSSPTMITARHSHRAVLVGTNVFVIGGSNDITTPSVITDVEKYNGVVFSLVTSMDVGRAFFGCTVINTNNPSIPGNSFERILVVGNSSEFALSNFDTYSIYDSIANTWEPSEPIRVSTEFPAKKPVVAATTTTIVLTGTQTIDMIPVGAGDRVLVKDQNPGNPDPTNGVYEVQLGAWTRVLDFDTAPEFFGRPSFFVKNGAVNGNKAFRIDQDDASIIGTTPLSFTDVQSEIQVYSVIDTNTVRMLDASADLQNVMSLGKYSNLITSDTIGNYSFMFDVRNGTPAANRKRETWQFTGTAAFQPLLTHTSDTLLVNVVGASRKVLAVAGFNNTYRESVAVAQQFVQTGLNTSAVVATNTWSIPDPIVDLGGVVLSAENGISIIRSDAYLQQILVPAGDYTAFSISQTIDAEIAGATATTYQTNKARIRTNSFGIDGDIALVAQETEVANLFGFDVDYFTNLTSHFGSVESNNSDIGTPNFEPTIIEYKVDSGTPDYPLTALINSKVDGGQKVNVQTRLFGFSNDDAGFNIDSNKGISSLVSLVESFNNRDYFNVGLRSSPFHSSMPNERAYVSNPYSIGPNDDIAVVVDKDVLTKRYPINMFRRIAPITSTYGSSNQFKDLDNNSQTLAVSFGIDYDFNDFAVYMKARTKSHSTDSTRSVLWRYYRFGKEGENTILRYVYPDAPDQPVTVRVIGATDSSLIENYLNNPKTPIEIVLGSGPERTANVLFPSKFNTSFFGQATTEASIADAAVTLNYFFLGFSVASASRDGLNETTLTLTVPDSNIAGGPTDIGIVPGNKLYLNSTDVNWTSGTFVVTSVDPLNNIAGTQDIRFTGTDVGVVGPIANIGSVSFNLEGEASFDIATANGDYVSSIGINSFEEAIERLRTYKILAHGAQYIKAYVLERGPFVASDPYELIIGGPVVWTPTTSDTDITIFQNKGQKTSDIVNAVNDLAAQENSTVPITGKVLGSGTGIITTSTWGEDLDSTQSYALTDGLNHVSKTTFPLNVSLFYTFDFKMPITGSLSTGSDWQNEELRLVPIHAHTISEWLNTPAISGLFDSSDIEQTDSGNKVQISTITAGSVGGIQVQSGTANKITAAVVGNGVTYDIADDIFIKDRAIVTIDKGSDNGIVGGAYIDVNNQENVLKSGNFAPVSEITSIVTDGTITFSNVSLWNKICETAYSPEYDDRISLLHFEKQGSLVAITISTIVIAGIEPSSFTGTAGPDPYILNEGDWLRLIRNENTVMSEALFTPSANTGVFRVVRVSSGKLIETEAEDNQKKYFYAETVWIENPNVIEGEFLTSFQGFTANSVMPGDSLVIHTDIFGSKNKGNYTIVGVGVDSTTGEQFTNQNVIKVDTAGTTIQALNTSPGPLGAERVSLVNVYESQPAHFIKKVIGVYPHQEDGSKTDIVFDTSYNASNISGSKGSVLAARDKLDFSTDIFSGIDAYRYNTGLVGEANKVVYGVSSDPDTYPGVAANGSQINISGPIVKRIKVSLSIRARTGVPIDELRDRVKSAVAAEINQTAVGQSISFSDILTAAGAVVGVIAVSVISPTFNSINDQIQTQPFEKLLILDLKNDISVTFVGQ